VRRRSLAIVAAFTLLALPLLAPSTALADGASGRGHHTQAARSTDLTGQLEVESIIAGCASATPCDYAVGPATALYAEADAYLYSGASFGTPDELYGECDRAWTDGMGVRHDIFATVDATSVRGSVWLMNSGAESNHNAMASISAVGSGDGGIVQIQGFGQFNNDLDLTRMSSGYTVNILGTIYHETYDPTNPNADGSGWVVNYTSFGSMTCNTILTPNSPVNTTTYFYGEAETPEGSYAP